MYINSNLYYGFLVSSIHYFSYMCLFLFAHEQVRSVLADILSSHKDVKLQTKSMIKPQYLEKINDAVINVNDITIIRLLFIKLYMFHLYQSNENFLFIQNLY